MILGTEDISISKKEVKESRLASINTTKTLIFKHAASAGDILIDTTALVTPSDAASRGFTQPNLAEVSELQLLVNKKNLKIHSSRGVWLQLYEDFIVTGQHTIQLVGNIADLGGALEGEVFTVYATPVQANSILTTDAKKMYQEYTLAEGQAVLNLGREFAVGTNPLSQIGSIRVFRNGVGPQLRNVGNAAANPLADGNYEEVDAGNGTGTTIEFNTPATGQDDTVVVEFGLEYSGDLSIIGDMQSLYGAFKKLIEDAAPAFGWTESRYLTFNPSEIERRGFGDAVIDLQKTVSGLGAVPTVQKLTSGSGTYTTPAGVKYLKVRLVGGGGGGGSTGEGSSGTNGSGGGATYFGALTANGGDGGTKSSTGQGIPALGGTASGGNIANVAGNPGWDMANGSAVNMAGPPGGASFFGGAGRGGAVSAKNGLSAEPNSGSGGGGASGGSTVQVGKSGGAGGYVEHIYLSPQTSYSYGVGGAGTGGSSGSGGGSGGNGGSGVIIIEEFY